MTIIKIIRAVKKNQALTKVKQIFKIHKKSPLWEKLLGKSIKISRESAILGG